MEFKCGSFVLTMLNDPIYGVGSADNVRRYDREYVFVKGYRASSQHGVTCRQLDGTERSCILIAGGGGSGVHEHSLVEVNETCFVAVGDMICSLALPSLDLMWATKVDEATCFGVYHSKRHNCLLSHGELEIARLNLRGQVEWTAGGADIFSEGFRLDEDQVEVIDFDRRAYRIDIASGQSVMVRPD